MFLSYKLIYGDKVVLVLLNFQKSLINIKISSNNTVKQRLNAQIIFQLFLNLTVSIC